MRIISGSLKTRRFNAPGNLPTRPTTDRAKESLFNILHHEFDLTNITVLDLFAGIGSISFEFLSRGAIEVISVDKHPKCVQFIKSQSQAFELKNHLIYRQDAFKAIFLAKKKFDIVFADPPYDLPNIPDIHKKVFEADILAEGGWLIIEHGHDTSLSDLDNFQFSKSYGKSNFSIFSK